MTVSSVSTVYKVYQAGSGQKNAKQSRQGQHPAFDERAPGNASAPTTASGAAATTDDAGDNDGAIGKAIDVKA